MFNLKLEEINFERVKAFCDQEVPECETIEYKSEIPANLEKTISAMANTYGGVILIGVEADQKNNVPVEIAGIVFEKGLEEKITGICYKSIYPPLFPEIKPCGFKDENGNEKAVLFIRVYGSDKTPHAINNNTDVYIRIKSQSEKFVRKARIDEIEWLKDRRKRAVLFRESLINKAREKYGLITREAGHSNKSFREVYVIPKYPTDPLFPTSKFGAKLKKMEETAPVEGLQSDIQRFIEGYQTATDSAYFFEVFQGDLVDRPYHFYSEFNIYGMTYGKNSLWEECSLDTQNVFDTQFFLLQVYGTLRKAILLYHTIGYGGLVKVSVDIFGLRGKEICRILKRDYKLREHRWIKNDLENDFVFEKDMLAHELEEKIDDLCLEIYKKFLWDCGVGKDLEEPQKLKVLEGDYNIAKNEYNKKGL